MSEFLKYAQDGAVVTLTMNAPEVRNALAQQGFDGYGMAPAAFADFFRLQHEAFNRIVRENNIKFE